MITPAQQRALDQIGGGNPSPVMSTVTRKTLLKLGLIVEIPFRLAPANRCGFVFKVRQYGVVKS